VYKRERLQPLSYYAHAEQAQPLAGLLWGAARDAGDDALRARCQMVRRAFSVISTALPLASSHPLPCMHVSTCKGNAGPTPSLFSLVASCICYLFCGTRQARREFIVAGAQHAAAPCCPRRAICAGLLRALAFCHGRGVAHGSLGPGSILLSTFEDRRARELIVKLDNFGFARRHRPAGQSAPVYACCMHPSSARNTFSLGSSCRCMLCSRCLLTVSTAGSMMGQKHVCRPY
jgi:hypothetical protein